MSKTRFGLASNPFGDVDGGFAPIGIGEPDVVAVINEKFFVAFCPPGIAMCAGWIRPVVQFVVNGMGDIFADSDTDQVFEC